MKHSVLAAMAVLIVGGLGPAIAADAPFGCEARAPNICHFRIYYLPSGTRAVVLPAGMKVKIPEMEIGRNQYCVQVGGPPASKCARKTINADYNS